MELYIPSIAVNDEVFVYLLYWCDGAVTRTVANKAHRILILKCRLPRSGNEVGAKNIYRVIKNDCRGFNNLSYTVHLR